MTQSIYDALPIVLQSWGNQHGVDLRFTGYCSTDAHTNGEYIAVPMIPMSYDLLVLQLCIVRGIASHEAEQLLVGVDPERVLFGIPAHEVGHQRYTNFEVYIAYARSATELKRALLNILEDVRMETCVISDLPGLRDDLLHACMYMKAFADMTEVDRDAHPASVFTGWVLGRGRTKSLGQPFSEMWHSAEGLIAEAFGDAFVDEVGALIDSAAQQPDTEAITHLVDEILSKVEAQAVQPPMQQPMPGASSDDSDSSEDETADTLPSSSAPADSESDSEASSDSSDDLGEGDSDTQSTRSDAVGEGEDAEDASDSSAGADDANADVEENDACGNSSDTDADGSEATADEQQASADGDSSDADTTEAAQTSSSDAPTSESDDSTQNRSPSKTVDDAADAEDSADGDGDSAIAQLVDELLTGKTDQDIFDQLKEHLNRLAMQNPPARSDCLLTVLEPEQTEDEAQFVNRAQSIASVTGQRLRVLLESQNRAKRCTKARGRRLDGRKLYRLNTADPRMFQHRTETRAPNTAVHVLIDLSCSMHEPYLEVNPIDIALQAGYSLAVAMDKLDGVSVAVSGFSDEFFPLHRRGDSIIHSSKNFGHSGVDTTATAQALLNAASELAMAREPRKIILVITDGEPNDPGEARTNIERCEAAGIEVMAIGIQLDLVLNDYKVATVIDDVDELPHAMFRMMQEALQQAS